MLYEIFNFDIASIKYNYKKYHNGYKEKKWDSKTSLQKKYKR